MTALVLFFNDFSEKDRHLNAVERRNKSYRKNYVLITLIEKLNRAFDKDFVIGIVPTHL